MLRLGYCAADVVDEEVGGDFSAEKTLLKLRPALNSVREALAQ